MPMKSVLPTGIVLPVHPAGMGGTLSLWGLLMLLERTVHLRLSFQLVVVPQGVVFFQLVQVILLSLGVCSCHGGKFG